MQVRLEMAKFLQETISETGFPGSADPKAAQEFADFFRKVNKTPRAFIGFCHLTLILHCVCRFVLPVNRRPQKIC